MKTHFFKNLANEKGGKFNHNLLQLKGIFYGSN